MKSFRISARRAALGMYAGTLKGKTGSWVRRLFVGHILTRRYARCATARWFAMRSLPSPLVQSEKFRATLNSPEKLNFRKRWCGPELMDDPLCDTEILSRTIDQFKLMNLLVSRFRSVLLQYVINDMTKSPGNKFHLIDLGAGGCDIPVWLLRMAKRRNLSLRITAIDGDPRTVNFAKKKYAHIPGLSVIHSDILSMNRYGPADYIFSNHVMHHLPDDVIPDIMLKMHMTANRRWIISDLYRSVWSYFGFQFLGRLFRNSFTFEDGKRSIRRGFIAEEMSDYVREAGLMDHVEIKQLHPGRIVVVGTCNHTCCRRGC
jgi:2-polyprenyl-3-methyl-5-hydroxy-6-metoxy-1,4-benzoquinol methylase